MSRQSASSSRHSHAYNEFHEVDVDNLDGDSFDDDLETPDILKPMLDPVVDSVFDPKAIEIDEEVGTNLGHDSTIIRINHHFAQSGLGYRARNGDTFALHVRSRKYPLFGTFAGTLTIEEDVHANTRARMYTVQGTLRYRTSILWFIGIISFFFLLIYFTHPGFWPGALFMSIGSALTIYTSHELGCGEREDVEERVLASFLRLRSTINNIR